MVKLTKSYAKNELLEDGDGVWIDDLTENPHWIGKVM
jgi:hypothetical protein